MMSGHDRVLISVSHTRAIDAQAEMSELMTWLLSNGTAETVRSAEAINRCLTTIMQKLEETQQRPIEENDK